MEMERVGQEVTVTDIPQSNLILGILMPPQLKICFLPAKLWRSLVTSHTAKKWRVKSFYTTSN